MYTTKAELKKEVMNDLQCPAEYIQHLARFGVFDDLKETVISDDRRTEYDIMKEIREGYYDYYRFAGINPAEDNRKARIGFFIY